MRKHGWFRPHVRGLTAISSTTLREGVGVVPAWVLSGAALDLDFFGARGYNSQAVSLLSLDDILTYTSPSPKLVYGDDGVLGYAPHNLFLASGDLSSASWGKIRGSATVDKFSCDSTADANHSFQQNVITTGLASVLTVELKPGEITTVFIQLGGAIIRAVNLSTGAMGSYSIGTSTASLVAAEDGYYQLTLSGVPSNTNLLFFAGEGDGSTLDIVLAGVRTGEGFYARRLQVSYGTVAFDYIPTTSAAKYSLPIDHDPITHEPLGVLIEEQRVNLLTYSEQFDNAAWTKSRVTVTANATTAPDGTTTADKLVPTAVLGTHRIYQTGITHGVLRTYSHTCYLKAGEYTFGRLAITDATEADQATCQFDLANGTVYGTPTASGTFSVASGSVVDAGNGWYRCTLIATCDATEAIVAAWVASGDTGGGFSFTGDGTSGIYLWGVQLEAGAFPTSYIPTVASQVTRAADQVSILTSAFAFNAAEGSLVSTQDTQFAPAATVRSIAYIVGTTGNYIHSYTYPNRGGLSIAAGGVAQCDLSPGSGQVSGVPFNTATAWDTDDVAMSVNGAAPQTDASVTLPVDLTTMILGGRGIAVLQLSGHIKRLTYFPTRKSNAELQALSA